MLKAEPGELLVRIVETICQLKADIAAARASGKIVGLVPTMGALHAGHLSLIEAASQRDDFIVVSIFVNPTQFGPEEDYERYPRQLSRDAELAAQARAHLVFAPPPAEMYPDDYSTWVEVQDLTEGLCGRFRPGHFRGVTTVVTKLLNIVQPDRAYFGEKDYQQLIVIKRMVRDLNIPVEIVGLPTVREADGLAVSSRNQYLDTQQRAVAPRLYQALQHGAQAARNGASGTEVERVVWGLLAKEPMFAVQYVQAVDPETLRPRGKAGAPMVIAAAVYLGDTRLIDNIIIKEDVIDAENDG